jgi:hypothetical protein
MNNTYNKNSSDLSISSKHIKDCNDVANFFLDMGIMCSVTENISVVPYKNKYITEKGCRIKMGSHKPELIDKNFWFKIKDKFRLDCAHLHVEGKFTGCIWNYIKDTDCPGGK